jgi:hypothetical protein
VGVETVAIAAADFDADGRDDLFLSTNGENSVSFVWGRADGELTDVDTYQWGKPGYWVGAGDIDNDGRLDALMLPDDAMSGEHLELHVRFGDGRRDFSRLRRYVTTGFNPTFASVADIDGDGLNDVLLLASRQRCVVLLRGLGGQGDLAEGRCIHRVEDADHDGPTFVSLGRDSDGRTHLLSEGARRSSGPRSLERWVLARDAGRVERVEPLTGLPEQYYSRASLTRAAGAQRIVARFDVDGAGRDRAPLLFTLSDDLSLRRCDATRVALQTDGAGVELPVTAGDFDGDGRLDHFGLTSWCSNCAGMLYAHLAR